MGRHPASIVKFDWVCSCRNTPRIVYTQVFRTDKDNKFLENFGCEGEDLHVILVSQLSCNRAKDTGSSRGLVISDDNGRVLVKTNLGAVRPLYAVYTADDNRLDNVTFFNSTAGRCFFNRSDDHVANVAVTSERTAHHTDTKNFFCTAVISDL